jgi:hypothetical protein
MSSANFFTLRNTIESDLRAAQLSVKVMGYVTYCTRRGEQYVEETRDVGTTFESHKSSSEADWDDDLGSQSPFVVPHGLMFTFTTLDHF